MKILFIGRWKMADPGGVDQVVLKLSRFAADKGHEVMVASPSRSRWALEKIHEEPGIEVWSLPIGTPCLWLKKEVKDWLRRVSGNYDVAWFFSVFTPHNIWMARCLACPYVVSPLGGYAHASILFRGYLKKNIFLAMLERTYLEKAVSVNVWSENEKGDLDRIASLRHFFVTPPGYDGEVRRVAKTNGGRKGRMLLFIGRFAIAQKGLDQLLDDFKKAAGEEDRLILAGADFRGGLHTIKDKIREPGLVGKVEIHPPAYGENKMRLYESSDIFIHESRWEGLPLAVVEALAAGLPVLVTKETNLATYVKKYDCGWVMDGNAAAVIQEALNVSAAEVTVKGENAARMVSEIFRWDDYIDTAIRHFSEFGLGGGAGKS